MIIPASPLWLSEADVAYRTFHVREIVDGRKAETTVNVSTDVAKRCIRGIVARGMEAGRFINRACMFQYLAEQPSSRVAPYRRALAQMLIAASALQPYSDFGENPVETLAALLGICLLIAEMRFPNWQEASEDIRKNYLASCQAENDSISRIIRSVMGAQVGFPEPRSRPVPAFNGASAAEFRKLKPDRR